MSRPSASTKSVRKRPVTRLGHTPMRTCAESARKSKLGGRGVLRRPKPSWHGQMNMARLTMSETRPAS